MHCTLTYLAAVVGLAPPFSQVAHRRLPKATVQLLSANTVLRVFLLTGFLIAFAPIAFADGPETADLGILGRRVADTYREVKYLSFEARVTERIQEPGSKLGPPRLVATADVVMASGDRLRLVVRAPDETRPVLTRVCNGAAYTEWTPKAWTTYPAAFYNGNVNLESDFDFCPVGSLLLSWVGGDTQRAKLLEERIGSGRHENTEKIDGHDCHVIVFDRYSCGEDGAPDRFLIRDSFHVDKAVHLVRRWSTMQADLDERGGIVQQITRQRHYARIRTASVDLSVFDDNPPPGLERRVTQTPALLVGKTFPPLAIDRWVRGREFFPEAEDHTLRTARTQVTLLDFMFPTCAPCRAALPSLSRLHHELSDSGFAVLTLCTSWGAADLAALMKEMKLRQAVAVLKEGAEARYFVSGYPLYVLIDQDRIVRWVGHTKPDVQEIRKLLAKRNDSPPP